MDTQDKLLREIETILEEGGYNGLPTHIIAEQVFDLFSTVVRGERLRSEYS